MAEQFLSDFAKPTLNGNVARRILANEVLRGVAQGEIETNGRGITQRFSNDTSGAQIRITQIMPLDIEARELGATLNGENFDSDNALQPLTAGLGVDVITTINQNIDIADVTQDMLPVDLLGNVTYQLSMAINNNINAMSLGGKFVACANDAVEGGDEFIVIDVTDPEKMRKTLISGNRELSNGDASVGLSYFPENDRIFVFKNSFVSELFANGAIIIGGSNDAQSMLRDGGISVGAKPTMNDGYVGMFMNVPCHVATDTIWNLAAKYAGIPAWKFDEVYGYVSSGFANVRAIAQQKEIKIIDAPNGAGIRIQPNFRMGFKSLYAKGNRFFVSADFVNPAEAGALDLKGPKSRPAYSKDTTLKSVSFASVAGSFANKVWTINVTSSVADGEFSNVVATAEGKAKVTYPTGKLTVKTGDNYFYIKVVAEDGTTSAVKVKVVKAK